MDEPVDIPFSIPELEESLPAEPFMEQSMLQPILWGSAIIIILVAAGLILWSKNRKPAAPPPTRAELAKKALAALAEDIPPMRELSLRLSLIIREFLTGETLDPALFETHEEFSQRMDALSQVPQECRFDTRCLLDNLVEMKYSGRDKQDSLQGRALIDQAVALIDRITVARQKEAAAAKAMAPTQQPS